MKNILPGIGLCSAIILIAFWRTVLAQNSDVVINASVSTKYTQPTDLITLRVPVNETVSGNLSQLKIINAQSGRMAYVFAVRPKNGNYLSYLALYTLKRERGSSNHAGKANEVSNLIYEIKKPINAVLDKEGIRTGYDPQFSPDGRYVLFKFGDPTSMNGKYRLYVFDTHTNDLKLASGKYLSYRLVSWSPDSNYIAFVEDGDAAGAPFLFSAYVGPLHLFVCNWRTGEERLVVSNDIVRGPFSWLSPHTLLYGLLSEQAQDLIVQRHNAEENKLSQGQQHKDNKQMPSKITKLEPRPNIYSYSFENRTSKLLFKDGFLPVPSPDRQQLAFFGSENPEKPYPLHLGWEDSPQGAALSVARFNGLERTSINEEGGMYPFTFWLPDNRHLLTVKQLKYSPNAQAEVKKWNTMTQRFQRVALLEAKDYIKLPRSIVEPQFHPLLINDSGDALFIYITEYTGLSSDSDYLTEKGSLKLVDLSTGNVTTLIETKNDLGMDWHEDAAPVISTTVSKTP